MEAATKQIPHGCSYEESLPVADFEPEEPETLRDSKRRRSGFRSAGASISASDVKEHESNLVVPFDNRARKELAGGIETSVHERRTLISEYMNTFQQTR